MEDIKIECPHCGQPIIADSGYIGQVVDCPDCGRAFVAKIKNEEKTENNVISEHVEKEKSENYLFLKSFATKYRIAIFLTCLFLVVFSVALYSVYRWRKHAYRNHETREFITACLDFEIFQKQNKWKMDIGIKNEQNNNYEMMFEYNTEYKDYLKKIEYEINAMKCPENCTHRKILESFSTYPMLNVAMQKMYISASTYFYNSAEKINYKRKAEELKKSIIDNYKSSVEYNKNMLNILIHGFDYGK